MGEMRIIGEKPGIRYHEKVSDERKVTWLRNNPAEISRAEEVFMKCITEGWIAYTVTSDDRKIQIFRFNPELELIVLVPVLYGG